MPRRPPSPMPLPLAALAGLALAAPVAAAAGPAELEEVVVNATPLRKSPLQTSQPTRILDEPRLIALRAPSLGETLSATPGLSSSWFGPVASRPLIRGQGGLRVQMYVDGGDALDVSALSDDHAVSIDPLLAQRIEVLQGPAALLFGNSAAAGAINVVTRRLSPERLPGPIAGAVELRGDTALGERALAARLGASLGGGWRIEGDVHRRRTDDVRIPGFAESAALRAEEEAEGEEHEYERDRLGNSAGETDGGAISLVRVGESGWFGVSVSRHDSFYGLPGHAEHGHEHDHDHEDDVAIAAAEMEGEEEEGVKLDLEQRRVDVEGEWRTAGGALESLRLRFARNDYEHSELEPGGEVGTRYAQVGEELRIAAVQREVMGWRGTFGAQWRRTDFDAVGEEAFLPPSATENFGLFVFQERALGPVVLEAGLRHEFQRIRVDEALGLEAYDAGATNGSIGALWTLREGLGLALNLNAVERHPTATELYASGPHVAAFRYEIGDATLDTERGRTADLSLRLGRPDAAWRATVSVFASRYDRYVIAAPTGEVEDGFDVVRYAATDARFTGAEIELSHERLAETAAGRLGARLFADSVRAEDDAGTPLPQIPPNRVGGALTLTGARLSLGLDAVWHDAQDRLAPGERATGGFTLVGVDVAWRMPWANGNILWFLRGTNLLDEEARRHASPLKDYAPLAGRSVAAGLRMEF